MWKYFLKFYYYLQEYVYLGIGDFCATVGLMFRGTDRLQLFQMIRSTGTACRQVRGTFCSNLPYISENNNINNNNK